MRRKREKNGDVGGFGVTASSQVGKNPSQTTVTAKCPRLRCRMREQAAIALRSLFEFAVRETIDKAAVASSYYMSSVAKLLKILHIPTLFVKYLMDSSSFPFTQGLSLLSYNIIIILFTCTYIDVTGSCSLASRSRNQTCPFDCSLY